MNPNNQQNKPEQQPGKMSREMQANYYLNPGEMQLDEEPQMILSMQKLSPLK